MHCQFQKQETNILSVTSGLKKKQNYFQRYSITTKIKGAVEHVPNQDYSHIPPSPVYS